MRMLTSRSVRHTVRGGTKKKFSSCFDVCHRELGGE